MVVKAYMSHPTEVPHPSKAEATTTTEVTPHIADEVPHTNDVKVNPPVKTHATALVLTNMSVNTNAGFLGGPLTFMFS